MPWQYRVSAYARAPSSVHRQFAGHPSLPARQPRGRGCPTHDPSDVQAFDVVVVPGVVVVVVVVVSVVVVSAVVVRMVVVRAVVVGENMHVADGVPLHP